MAACNRCGRPRSECADRERIWYPQRVVCFVSAEIAAAGRSYARLHQDRPFHDGTFKSWAEKSSDTHPYHYDDGVTIIATEQDYAPGDLFTTDMNAAPWDEPESPEG